MYAWLLGIPMNLSVLIPQKGMPFSTFCRLFSYLALWTTQDWNNFEHDHQIWVKSAVRRTQMRYASMMEQLEDAVDRVDAVRGMRSLERSPCIGIYIKCVWYLYQCFLVCHVCHLTDAILGPVLRQKRRQPDNHLMCNELLGFVVPIPSKKPSKSDIDGAQFRTFRRLGCLLKTRQGR